MKPVRVDRIIQADGELHLAHLPCRKGDRAEGMIYFRRPADADARMRARKRFLARARASRLRSAGPYPSRDDLHDRA